MKNHPKTSCTSEDGNSRYSSRRSGRIWRHFRDRQEEARVSIRTSNAMRYTCTHLHRQSTTAESCRVKRRREEMPCTEPKDTLSDEKGKRNKSVRVAEVYSSQGTELFAWISRCRSTMSLMASFFFLVHTIVPTSNAMTIPAPKTAVDREWDKLHKLPAWNTSTVRCKQDVINEAKANNRQVHLTTLMDLYHLKHSELAEHLWTYRGRVVLRGADVKDGTGGYAVFTKQGASASHMTAAEVLDVVSRMRGMPGEANDAVSAYTQVKMNDAPRLLELPKTECPTVWIRLPRNRLPKNWDNIDDPMVPLERNLHGHGLAALPWEGRLDEVPLLEGRQKRTQLGMSSCSPTSSTLVISTRRRHKKWQDEKPAQLICGSNRTKKLCDLENRTPLVDQGYIGCTQRESITK